MNYPKRFLLPSLLAFAIGFLPAPASAGQVDFNGLAEKFFKAHPVEGRSVGDVTLDELVAEHYALAQVGAIDVRFPREFLEDKGVVEDFKDSVGAILAVHELWLDWIGAPAEQVAKAKVDFAELRKFLKGARPGGGGSKAKNFLEIFSGSADAQAALDRLRDGFRTGTMMGVTPLSTKPQVFDRLLPEVKKGIRKDSLVVSIAAGIPVSAMEAAWQSARSWLRSCRCPNEPLPGCESTNVYDARHRACQRSLMAGRPR